MDRALVRIDYEHVSMLLTVLKQINEYPKYRDIQTAAERELQNIEDEVKEELGEIIADEQEQMRQDKLQYEEDQRQLAQDSADAGHYPTAPIALPNPALAPVTPGTPSPTSTTQAPVGAAAVEGPPANLTPGPAAPGANETGMAHTSGVTQPPVVTATDGKSEEGPAPATPQSPAVAPAAAKVDTTTGKDSSAAAAPSEPAAPATSSAPGGSGAPVPQQPAVTEAATPNVADTPVSTPSTPDAAAGGDTTLTRRV